MMLGQIRHDISKPNFPFQCPAASLMKTRRVLILLLIYDPSVVHQSGSARDNSALGETALYRITVASGSAAEGALSLTSSPKTTFS